MDTRGFDNFAKQVGALSTRRTTLKGIIAGLLAVGGLRGRDTGAQGACPVVTATGQGTNPSCGGLKIDPPTSGCQPVTTVDRNGNPCTCRLCYEVTGGGRRLSFSGTCYVGQVIVKGGNEGANIYDYSGCPTQSGSGLTTPTGQGISHFEFCAITCCTPATCPSLGKVCGGPYPDGCGGQTAYCGDCTCPQPGQDGANFVCSGGGTQCACTATARDVACANRCGEVVGDGCCGTYQCDACPPSPPPPSGRCLHSFGPTNCKDACAAGGTCNGRSCEIICSELCPVGQGDDNPCCEGAGACDSSLYACRGRGAAQTIDRRPYCPA